MKTCCAVSDAEKVVRKEQQVLTDSELPEDYLLTVFPFSTDVSPVCTTPPPHIRSSCWSRVLQVFLYVSSAQVDLSAFAGDQDSLVQSLRSAHRSVRFCPRLHRGKVTIEGPFVAVRALREDLVHGAHRTARLRPSAPAADVQLREGPLRVISGHELVRTREASSVGFSEQQRHRDKELRDGTRPREETSAFSGSADRRSVVGQKPRRRSPEDPEDPEGSVWIDSCVFRYIERFDKKECDRRLKGLDLSVRYGEGTDLMRISLTEKKPSTVNSRIQPALEDLNLLVDRWQSILRVYEIRYDEDEDPQAKQKLVRICEDVNVLFDDILYLSEDSCVKVIGPPGSSFCFYRRVEDRLKEQRFRL